MYFEKPQDNQYFPSEAARQSACVRALKLQGSLLSLSVTVSLLVLYLFQTAGARLLVRLACSGRLPVPVSVLGELFTALLYPAAFLLPFLVLARLSGLVLRTLPHAAPCLPVSCAAVGISLGLSALLSVLLLPFQSLLAASVSRMPGEPLGAALYLANTVLLPPLIEELSHRGIVLGVLRRFGDRLAIVASALLFALMHRSLGQFANALLMGLLLGYFVIQTDSIWTGVAVHLANNLSVILWETLCIGQPPAAVLLLQLLRFALCIAAGAAGAAYLLGRRRVRLGLRRSDAPVREGVLLRKLLLHPPMVVLAALFCWIFYLNL